MAYLAALRVDEESLPQLTRDIARILEYVSRLRQADVDPAGSYGSWLSRDPPLPPREDGVRSGVPTEELTRPAPLLKEGFFVVPKLEVMEEG